MSCPEPYRPFDPMGEAASLEAEFKNLPSDSQVRALTSALAAGGGGNSSPDLALDLVLNQIVEQACLATGATGAAIALTRDGEMVCRATTGTNAPDLGVRLDNAGFSAECLRVGTLQRCDDTETDPRVDATACRLLGVRSILVIPLWYWGEFMGIFEIFSPRPNAFGERDEQTVQALAYRIVRHTKQATGSIAGFTADTDDLPEATPAVPAPALEPGPEPEPGPEMDAEPEQRRAVVLPMPVYQIGSVEDPSPSAIPARPDRWTAILAGVAVVIAGLIVGLMVWRVGWGGDASKQSMATPRVVQANTAAPGATDPTFAAPHEEILELGLPPEKPTQAPRAAVPVMASQKASEAPAPQGGLAIYEKGKLIYGAPLAGTDHPVAKESSPRMQAAPKQTAEAMPPSVPTTSGTGAVQLSPEMAENLLVNRVEPEYPDAARRARIQGSVTMEALIGADGKVQEVTPIGGSPQLADAATAAVRQWRYKPYVVDGRKVAVRTQVSVTFMLAE
jgi:TonB family protein